MLRGGYVRQVGQGIYDLLPLAQRVRAKVETIVREEMNALNGQEVQMPLVTPAELWIESGRYQTIGAELVRFTDRTDHPHVLNMTNEETVVDLVRGNVDSYRQLPLMVYQIQTKFRDEPRSRAGLIRVREFTMKDGYSFHRTQEDLGAYYERMRLAYEKIFKRCGFTKVVDIQSDVGMMGGSMAHEFMLLSPNGEDTILVCEGCGYRANREIARTDRKYEFSDVAAALTDAPTPGRKTIEEVSSYLKVPAERTMKAVLFAHGNKKAVIAFVRGDLEVNQARLRKIAGAHDLRPMREDEVASFGIVAGYVGPQPAREGLRQIFDISVTKTPNLVIGGNKDSLHRTGFNFARDLADADKADVQDISEARENDPCPQCNKGLTVTRGIEVGNIFQLGTKYTEAMSFTYTDEDGGKKSPIMGCYGIGIGRTLACVIEEHHDDKGPLWPISVAPFEVAICCLQIKKPGVLDAARELYKKLREAKVEVILDDREVSAGFQFADADLIGAPVRLIVSPRNVDKKIVEMKYRLPATRGSADLPGELPLGDVEGVLALVRKLRAELA